MTAALIVAVLGFMRWNEYREKDLVDVLEVELIVAVRYGRTDNMTLEGVVNDEKSIQEIIDFLSQYRVKKEGSRDFTSEYPGEQFVFQTEYEDERITIPNLIERSVILIELD